MKKIILSLLLAIIMLCLLLPMTAMAEGQYIDRVWDASAQKVVETAKDIPSGAEELTYQGVLGGGWYVVKGDNVNYSSRVIVEGTPSNPTRIILCDGAKMTIQGGIGVESGKALVIYGQSAGTGKLYANGYTVLSGIGGGNDTAGGEVTINGGTVTATGGEYAPGIGGGYGYNAACGTVTINGGTVTATGGLFSAGIGGGNYAAGGTVTINGGTVTATAGSSSGAVVPLTVAGGIGAGSCKYGEEKSQGVLKVANGATIKAGSAAPGDSTTVANYTANRDEYVSIEMKLTGPGTVTNAASEASKSTNHGYITIDKATAYTGETVTVTTIVPNDGYELESLVYTDSTDHDFTETKSFQKPGANVTVKASFKQMAAAPVVASPAKGIYTKAQSVTLSTTTEGADIYYTTDGTTPTTNSTKYSGAITVDSSKTIKAIAVKQNWLDSEVMTAEYTITGTVAMPVASPAEGIYTKAQSVTLSTTSEDADIYYTTDGTTPTTDSTKYSGAITVDRSKIIKAIAVKQNWEDSEVMTAEYTITGTVAMPVASPAAGVYTTVQNVELSTITEGAEIFYTIDGSTPTANSIQYTSAISVTKDMIIKAIATKADWIDSEVMEAAYTIQYPVTKVEVSPDTLVMKPGETEKVTVTVYPENATDKTLTWSVDVSDVVKIGEDGTVTALKEGTVKVTVKSSNGVSATVTITVKADAVNYVIIKGAK